MEQAFDIQSYMTHGVERVVGEIVKATLKNPKESVYMARFALASRAASKKRRKAEDAGEHIPAFLIASITSQCNLHCAGCYSRCNHATAARSPARSRPTQISTCGTLPSGKPCSRPCSGPCKAGTS